MHQRFEDQLCYLLRTLEYLVFLRICNYCTKTIVSHFHSHVDAYHLYYAVHFIIFSS